MINPKQESPSQGNADPLNSSSSLMYSDMERDFRKRHGIKDDAECPPMLIHSEELRKSNERLGITTSNSNTIQNEDNSIEITFFRRSK